jgi:outer membrane lipase/esterase
MRRSFSLRFSLRLIGATVLAASALAAQAGPYVDLVVFGDSLSDGGNNALVVGTDAGQVITGNSYVPSLPYGSGVYSNGPVWVNSFAAALGLGATPSLAGGHNFAYGGARTRVEEPGGFPASLRSQVGSFLDGVGGVAASNALYVIAGGGNNARSALDAIAGGAPLLQTVASTALNYAFDIGRMVDRLQAAGAVDIIVWNTPNLGVVPAVTAEGNAASFLGQLVANAMNRALELRLRDEVGVSTFDVFGLVTQVTSNPAAFGLVNASDACGGLPGCDVATALFWDGIHPTAVGHQLLANAMIATVVPEPGVVWLFSFGLIALLLRRRLAR